MITKEYFLSIRDQPDVPMSLFYEYWLEKKVFGYTDFTYKEFSEIFPKFILENDGKVLYKTNGEQKIISFSRIVYKVLRYFNEKFKLV